jgi:protein SCO1/2
LALLIPLTAGGHGYPGHDPEDQVFEETGVTEKLGAALPLDLAFTDQDGKAVKLKDYFTGRPVAVSFNYYECPMICSMFLSNLADTANDLGELSLERDYQLITVSINAKEKLESAKRKAEAVHGLLAGVAAPNPRWPFLIGSATNIRIITQAAGVSFKELPHGEFAHPMALLVLTPEGKISRYLYGVQISPRDLRLALLEAAGGRIGQSATVNRVLMYCFHYDPVGKKYELYAINLMKAAGVLTLAGLALLFLALRRRQKATPSR